MTSTVVVDMELEEPTKLEFMRKYPRYETKIRDHTATITAKTCLRKYFYQIVLGRVGKESAIYFAWGSAYHKFREVLEVAYGVGAAAPKIFDEIKAQEAFVFATQVGTETWKKLGRDQEVGSKYEFMTTARLVQSFIVAFKHWTKEKIQNRIEVIAVEQAFNVQLRDGSSTSGRADQIVRWNAKLWGRDFKSSSKDSAFFERSLEPNDQFTRYTWSEGKLCGERVQGQIIEVLLNKKSTKTKSGGPEIFEHITTRTSDQLDRWEEEQIFWNKLLKLARDEDMYPMQEVSCPFCPYHSVCTKPTEGAMMAQLEAHFVVRPWDNTKIGVTD